MSTRSTHHATFVIERTLAYAPSFVFAAWSDPEAKSLWFGGTSEWRQEIREFDFRVGGRERLRGTWKSGHVSDFQCLYHDIVPNERIVYTYDMYVDARHLSVSIGTIEFKASGSGTHLVVTEQGVFLDGADDARSREHGTRSLLDTMEGSLRLRAASR